MVKEFSNTVSAQPKTYTRLHYKHLNPLAEIQIYMFTVELKSMLLQCEVIQTSLILFQLLVAIMLVGFSTSEKKPAAS